MARRISVEIVGDSSSLERSFRRSSRAATGFERDIGRAGRGVAAVSLRFAGLGRSLAFASTAFIGGAGLAVGFKAAIEGAESLAKAQESVRVALEHTGQDVGKLLPEYDATAKAAAKLGVSQTEALSGLAKATTLTGNAAAASRAYTEALNISKAIHVSFDSALTATAKGQEGITTSLRRYGIQVDKTTSGTKQFQIVMQRFGGQAEANTSNLDRLRASAQNLATQLGGPLLGVLDSVAERLTHVATEVSAFFTRVGQAHTFQAKVDVVVSGLEHVAGALTSAIGAAVGRIDWNAVWANARGVADGLQRRLDQINWGSVGSAIGKGIAKGVAGAGAAFKELAGRVEKAFNSINFVSLGVKLGPALAGAVVAAFATLTDPSFWIHHWQLALSVALVAFGDGVGKILAPLARFGGDIVLAILRPIERLAPELASALLRGLVDLGGVAEDGVLKTASAIARIAPRLGEAFLSGVLALPRLVARALQPLTGVVSRVFGRLGRFSQFVVKVLGVDAAIQIVTRAVSQLAHLIGHGLDQAWEAMKRSALRAALAIVEPFSHLPGFLGGGPFQRIKASLQAQLSAMDRSAQSSANAIGDSFDQMGGRVARQFRGTATSVIHSTRAAVQGIGAELGKLNKADVAKSIAKAGTAAPSQLSTTGGNVTPPASSTVAKGFVLPFRLQLAQARASATKTVSDDLAAIREIRAFIVKAIPHLHGQKLIDAYTQLGQINQQIAGAVQQAAKIGKDFAVPIQLQVADARAQALGSSETGILRQIRSAAQRAIRSGRLSAQGQISAWNEIASVNQQLKDAAQQIAQKGRNFTEPIKLQIAEARALALGTSDTGILLKMKKAAEKALKSGKLSAQGQIDAWNEIASINQQLGAAAKSALGGFKQINTRKITAGLNLTAEQRAQLRARLSQIGPGGTAPQQGTGAFGFIINPKTDRPIIVKMDGKKVGESVRTHEQKARRRNSSQVRGPNAGMAFGF